MTTSSGVDSEPNAVSRLSRWVCLLLIVYVLLLPAEPLFNVPIALLATAGIWVLITDKATLFKLEAVRLLSVIFLCIWVPMALATLDAVNTAESLRKTLSFLIFYPMGLCVIAVVCEPWFAHWIVRGVFAVVAFWVVDALVQFTLGTNLLGFPHEKIRLTGVFYPRFGLGVALAVLAPFVLEAVRWFWRWSPWTALVLIPYLLVIILSGSRSSWVVFSVALLGYAFYLARWAGSSRLAPVVVLRTIVVGFLLTGALFLVFPNLADKVGSVVSDRVERTLPIFQGDKDGLNRAVARRLSLWETGANMFEVHWLNGIGPRGYRYVYAEFAPEDDYFRGGALKGAPTHPHQILLEIAVETGLVGVLGYLIALVAFFRRLASLSREQLSVVFPSALAFFAAIFPLNVHHAFYGNFSSTLMCWLLAVFLGIYQSVVHVGGQASKVSTTHP